MDDSTPERIPKTQTAPSGGPPKPPKKTARGLHDESGEPTHEGDRTSEMVTVVTNADTTLYELIMLNGGGRRLKRESLEMNLDRNILALSRLVKQVESEDQEIVIGTLRSIRDYRHRFPRCNTANLEQSVQAQKALDEIK